MADTDNAAATQTTAAEWQQMRKDEDRKEGWKSALIVGGWILLCVMCWNVGEALGIGGHGDDCDHTNSCRDYEPEEYRTVPGD